MPGPQKQFDRDEALAKATDVFWAHGYEATSVEELLGAMGLSRSSMYSTFGDKRALFLEALQRWIDDAVASFVEELHGPGTLPERLMRAFEKKHNLQAERGNIGCFFGNAVAEGGTRDPEIRRVLEGFASRIERTLRKAFDDALARGELPAQTDTRALAFLVLTLGQGAALLGQMRPDVFERLGPIMMRLLSGGAMDRE